MYKGKLPKGADFGGNLIKSVVCVSIPLSIWVRRPAACACVRVLHLEAGDVENDVFMEKVRTVTDDSHSTE